MKKIFLVVLSILFVFVAVSCKGEDEFTFELNYSEYTLNIGDEVVLNPDKSDESYEWDSSNVEVATVLNGCVKAITVGTTTISATANDVTKTCQITVKDELEAAPYFYLDVSTTKIFVASKIQIHAYFVNGEQDSDVSSAVNWSVDNDNATIDNDGVLTGVSEGTSVITATYTDESGQTHKDTCEISVTIFKTIQYLEERVVLANPITVSGADNDKNVSYKPDIQVLEGSSDPLDLSTVNISYSSANEDVARVNADGTIVAVGSGSTSITAKFKDKESSILVKVADTIASKADLDELGFATKEGNDHTLLSANRYYILVDDIDYEGKEIVPIAISHAWQEAYAEYGRESYDELNPDLLSFYATLDGCGYAIKNAVLPSSVFVRDDLDVGIGSCFIGSNYGTLKNIAFYNLTTQLVKDAKNDIKEEYYEELSDTVINSGLVVENYGTLENIYLDIIVKTKNYLGSRSGCLTAFSLAGSTIENCIVVATADYSASKPWSIPSDCGDYGAVIGQSENAPFTVRNSFAISSNMSKFIYDNRYASLNLNGLLYGDAQSFINDKNYILESMGKPWNFENDILKFGELVALNENNEKSIDYTKSEVKLFASKTLSGENNTVNTSVLPELVVLIGGESADASTLDIDYSSLNPSVATVSEDGTITALSVGNAVIKAQYSGKTATINVSVYGVLSRKADLDVLGYATKEDPSLLAADKYYVLTQDIDYEGAEIVPIAANPTFIESMMRYGREDYDDLNPDFIPFAATIDGMGYVIKNARIPSTTMVSSDHQFTLGAAFIGKNQGTIKNIGFVNLSTQLVANEASNFNTGKAVNSDVEFDAITDTVTFCGLVNTNMGTLKNIYLDMKIYKKNYGYYGSGALVANSEGGFISNCIVVADKDYNVQGFKDYTGDASDITEFGVVIGVQRAVDTTISNVYAVSSTLTKFVSLNESSITINDTVYGDVASLVAAKLNEIDEFDGAWLVTSTELRFGNHVIWSSES